MNRDDDQAAPPRDGDHPDGADLPPGAMLVLGNFVFGHKDGDHLHLDRTCN